MLPDSGTRKPAIRRSRVVLPQPEGPSTVVNDPCGTWRVTSSTARVTALPGPVEGNDLVTPVRVSEPCRDLSSGERRADENGGVRVLSVLGVSTRISRTVAGMETSTSSSA